MPNQAVILSATRSAIGTYLGGLASFSAPQLGAFAIKEAVKRAGINAEDIDEVIMGQVVQGGSGQAPGRQAAIHSGVPSKVPALTINKVCGSGLKAVMLSAQAIKAGDGTGTMKQDNVRMGTEIVDDAINLVNGQSINPKILIPGIMIDKDNIDQYLPKS